jgi:hypothetical protein
MEKFMNKTNIMITLTLFAGFCAMADEVPGTNNTATALQSSMNRSMDDMTGKFGAGLVIGEPTGPTVKYWFNDTVAIDGTLGWSLRDDDNIYLNADILWHSYDLIQATRGRAAVYYGVGPSIEFRRNADNRFGVRAPIGVSYKLDDKPVDVFVEVAPILDFAPGLHGDFNVGIGVRYWF